MFKKKWQQPLIFLLEVDGKVWDRQEAGPHHIDRIISLPSKEAVQFQFHYSRNLINRALSDVNVGGYGYVTGGGTRSNTSMAQHGIKHNAGKNEYDPTLNLQGSDTAPIGPS